MKKDNTPLLKRIKRANLVKKATFFTMGLATYPGINLINSLQISGTEYLEELPPTNVLIVSNHQTYFTDVICFYQIFCAVKWGKKNRLGMPYYLLNPFTQVHFVAAEETMKSSFLAKIFALSGAVTVKRSWRAEGENVNRGLDTDATDKIDEALENGWLINFPQGTTKAFSVGRKGVGHLIKKHHPVVLPVVINGFRRAFDKKGLKFKKTGTTLSIDFKAPLEIDYEADVDAIVKQVMDAIEQSEEFKDPAIRDSGAEK